MMYFENKVFSFEETTNNRFESAFNKIKRVSFKYTDLMQFSTEFLQYKRSLHPERNHHFLMNLVRESTGISTNPPLYKNYADLFTQYAFSHV